MTPKTNIALSIAGSDPSGGAGIQADLKVFHQHQVYGMAVITVLTSQDTQGVHGLEVVTPNMVEAQCRPLVSDLPPDALKIGALGNTDLVHTIATLLSPIRVPVVLDPVFCSSNGAVFLDAGGIAAVWNALLPHVTLITPNVPEAEQLSGIQIANTDDAARAAERIASRGPSHVLIKGGHFPGPCVDVLWTCGELIQTTHPRHTSHHTHGTGCVLSAAITARLAGGAAVPDAVSGAQAFVQRAIRGAPGLGRGRGPLDLHASVDPT